MLAQLLDRALAEPAGEHATDERILDAALREFAAHGTEEATMTHIAERAGVGRMTVFRHFGGKEALVERLVLRELRRFLEHVDATLGGIDDPGERVVEAFLLCVRAGAEHPLIARLARTEPGPALERLSRGDPSPLDLGREFVAARLPGRSREVADVLVRLAASYVFLPGPTVDASDASAARDLARRTLAPMVRRSARPNGR
jgi:AcrR family transcriptional regulator